MASWEILETTEYSQWVEGLSAVQRIAVQERLHRLKIWGPALGRPEVDLITGSSLKNLKELRVSSKGAIRILFIFDPNRRAVLLLGGDKSKDNLWNGWYQVAIPKAEQVYKKYLMEQER